jgi:hypothetical protein
VTEALKSCPFCGGTPAIVTRDVEPQGDPWYGSKKETFVLCDCGACLFDGSFHEGFWDADTRAVEAWNRRAPDAAPAGEPATVKLADWRANKLEAVFGARGEAAERAKEQMQKLNEHSRAYMKALAALVNLDSREFKGHPGSEWIDREQAMRLVPALRDHASAMAETARNLLRAALRADERAISASGEKS